MGTWPAAAADLTMEVPWPVTKGRKYSGTETVAVTCTYLYPDAGFGLVTQGPAAAVANVTKGLVMLAVPKFHLLVEAVAVLAARLMPALVPSSTIAAPTAAASQ